jgi:hypothetical protein
MFTINLDTDIILSIEDNQHICEGRQKAEILGLQRKRTSLTEVNFYSN